MGTGMYLSEIGESHGTDHEDSCILVCNILSSSREVTT